MTDWFTSDPHFYHIKVATGGRRPFSSVDEMNSELISRYNNKVKDKDSVYILGDFSFGTEGQTHDILNQLKGKKHLILGNHDRLFLKNTNLHYHFEWIKHLAEVKIQDHEDRFHRQITLCHYSMKVWNKRHFGAWQLYGHSHGYMPDDPNSLQIDVGVDCHNYEPISFEEIKAIMKTKKNVPVDGHGKSK